MSFAACETLVKAGDPDRWRSTQSAPPEARRALMAIYAVNLEIARAPWASPEPLIAQMRLQWWADEIGSIYAGKAVTTHEILLALREVIFDHNLPQERFVALTTARHFDLGTKPFENRAAFDAYIDGTAGSVMGLATTALGATADHRLIINDYAYAVGVATILRATPALKARGYAAMPDGVSEIVEEAIKRLKRARALRCKIPRALAPALLAGWRANATLAHAQAYPSHIAAGLLEESPMRKMASLRWQKITRRW